MATRDNRIAAESVGIDVTKFKLLAFTISAALAGVAGVLYAHNLSMLKVSGFDYNMSILILVYVVLGGIGNPVSYTHLDVYKRQVPAWSIKYWRTISVLH